MKGSNKFHEKFGRVSEKTLIENRTPKAVPSKKNSKKISCAWETDYLDLDIDACLTPYLQQAVCKI